MHTKKILFIAVLGTILVFPEYFFSGIIMLLIIAMTLLLLIEIAFDVFILFSFLLQKYKEIRGEPT